jgi:hypothetical protein
LSAGRLPIEISTRGARFAAEADQAAERDEARIKELEHTTVLLREGLERVRFEIRQLDARRGDKT